MKHVLSQTAHRPWDLPASKWIWYQEWNNVVFIHGRINMDWLRKQVPEGFSIDTFYISPSATRRQHMMTNHKKFLLT